MPLVSTDKTKFEVRAQFKLKGFAAVDMNGDDIAVVEDVLFDDGTRAPRYVVFTVGGMLGIRGKKILVPWEVTQVVKMGLVSVRFSRNHVQETPSPLNLENIARQEEDRICAHFDIPRYWEHDAASGVATFGEGV